MSALKYWDAETNSWEYLAQGVKGDAGSTGSTGATGAAGATGPGVATGGTTGQILSKKSGDPYDTEWKNINAGVTSVDGLTGAVNLTTKYEAKSKAIFAAALGNLNPIPNTITVSSEFVTTVESTTETSPITIAQSTLYNTPLVSFRGLLPIPVISDTSTLTYYSNNATGYESVRQSIYWVEFDHYGSEFALKYSRGKLSFPNGPDAASIWVWVDGKPLTSASVDTATAAPAYDNRFYSVKFFTSSAKTTPLIQQRRIRIMMADLNFGGIDIGLSDTLFPINQPLLKVVLVDGSWFAGGFGAVEKHSNYLAVLLGELLNVDYYISAIESTGYVRGKNVDPILGSVTSSNAGGANWCDSLRLQAIYAINPDLVIFLGTTNDDAYTASGYQLQNHAAYVYNAIATNVPTAKLIVFARGSNSTISANAQANADAVIAAATAASNVIGYVNPYADSAAGGAGWINDNNSGTFINTGDNHPNALGNKYYANRMYSRIVNILKTFVDS